MTTRDRQIAIYVGLLIIVSNANGSETPCKVSTIQSPVHNQACDVPGHVSISATERHKCSLSCIRSEKCKATIYDVLHSVCKLLPEPCSLLEPYVDHVYQAFQKPCTKWVPNSDAVKGFWIYEGSSDKSYIARAYVNADLLVGKVTSKFFTVRLDGSSVGGIPDYEELLVDASCTVTWVSYNDSSVGQPMPPGAVVGGLIAASNTPLYVSRLHHDTYLIAGYYNPLNQKAWGQYSGTRSGTIFDIMVVKAPSVLSWVYQIILQDMLQLLKLQVNLFDSLQKTYSFLPISMYFYIETP